MQPDDRASRSPQWDPESENVYRILVSPNAYKGSLSAIEAARAIKHGILAAGPLFTTSSGSTRRIETQELPLADGGDGTLETLVAATGGTLSWMSVSGPLGSPVEAAWGRLGGEQSDTAVIEMARASGLCLLSRFEYDPLRASTFGTGQLMRAALDAGCRTLLVAIGGSATNDGGAGMAQALGARLLDAEGVELPPGGAALGRLERIDLAAWALPAGVTVRVACDVDNPLCGLHGAAAVYGPQKGATAHDVNVLDAALSHYADVLQAHFGFDVRDRPGAGAAGGLGAGLLSFCGGQLLPGADLVLDVTGFDALCRRCQLVMTGEGRLDGQTARGKLIAGVARRAQSANIPVVALVGGIAEGADEILHELGLNVALSIVDGPQSVEQAVADGPRLLATAATNVVRLLKLWL